MLVNLIIIVMLVHIDMTNERLRILPASPTKWFASVVVKYSESVFTAKNKQTPGYMTAVKVVGDLLFKLPVFPNSSDNVMLENSQDYEVYFCPF